MAVLFELRYALRLMRQSPAFTAVAACSLALGVGANTAIFSLLDTVSLRPLPVEHPEQLVEIMQKYPGEPRGLGYWGWKQYEHYRDHNHVFSAVTGTAFDNLASAQPEGGERETLVLESVPGNYFPVLGLRAAVGRLIGPQDVPASGPGDAVVVSWQYWKTRLGGSASAIGRQVRVGKDVKTVVGVAPRSYIGPRVGARTDVWEPNEHGAIEMLARLKPGITLAQARAECEVLFVPVLADKIAHSKDPQVRYYAVEVDSAAAGFNSVRDRYGRPLVLLMGVVGILLLLACVNIASLLLARSAGRQRELAVRIGLGASGGRLARQMLTESALLSALGTLLGVAVAYAATGALTRIIASGRPWERVTLRIEPDLRVLLFTAAAAIATGLLFGAAPAWRAWRTSPAACLRQMGRAGETRARRLLGKGLVAAQVALSILLVCAGGVFLAHVTRMRANVGFRGDHVLLIQLDPARSGHSRTQLGRLYRDVLARLEAIPGVRSATIAGCTPIQGCGASRFAHVEGITERPEERRYTSLSLVAPRYFETLGIPLLAGRDFLLEDAARGRVAIISESMARHYFPGANPVGKHIFLEGDPNRQDWFGGDQAYEVVGVVGDVKQFELRDAPPRMLYVNMYHEDHIVNQFALRTAVAPGAVAAEARRVIRDVTKTVAVQNVTTLADQVDAAIVPERLIATLSGLFGIMAAALAGIGVYGLLAYSVSRRTSEIGVRMALGATAGRVALMVVGDAFGMTAAGLLGGAALAWWSRPLAARLLPDLRTGSTGPVLQAAAVILALAAVAAYLPARRASRVDPIDALRQD